MDHRRATSEPLLPSRKFPELLAQREGGRESAPGTCPVFRCGRVTFSISEASVGEFALGLLAAGKVVVPNDKVRTNLDPQIHPKNTDSRAVSTAHVFFFGARGSILPDTHRHPPTPTDTHRHTPTPTDTHRHPPTHTDTHRHTPTHTDTYRHTPTHTDTHTHRHPPTPTDTHRGESSRVESNRVESSRAESIRVKSSRAE